jgi:hypothetical protein
MSSTKNPEEFANNLEAIMGANQDMLNDVLADLLAVMPPDQAEAMKRTLMSIHDEYETDMANLIKQTRADAARLEDGEDGAE